jgi:hypothetical protein
VSPTFVIANLVAQSHLQDAYSAFPDAPVQPFVERTNRLQSLLDAVRRPVVRRTLSSRQPACP